MAEQKPVIDTELDENGKPIQGNNEGGKGTPPKINSSNNDNDGKADPDEEPEIPVRKSALQHIIARKNKQIEKLRSKGDDEVDLDDDDNQPALIDKDDDDELTPEARGAVRKEVLKAITPLASSLAKNADEQELQDLLSAEPEAQKYEKRIRVYMEHKSYKGVPPSVIYHHLAFGDAETTGAHKKRVADTEAKMNKGGGSTRRPSDSSDSGIPSEEEMDNMSDAEFETLQHKARTGEFVKNN